MSKKIYRVNVEKFISMDDALYIYILGYIWADGHLNNKYSIELYTSKKDFQNINNIIMRIGNCYVRKRNRLLKQTNRYYISYTFGVTDKKLSNFLINLDFDKKI
jgi:hypothetical protein